MDLIIELLIAIGCAILIVSNLLVAVCLSRSSLNDQKESLCELFEGRNVFGCILSGFVMLLILPGIIFGNVVRLLVLCVVGIWKLGDKDNFPLN